MVALFKNDNRQRLASGIYVPTPEIKKRKKEFSFSFLRWLIPCFAVLALIWWLFLSPTFKVNDIIIEGEISSQTKEKIESLRGRNIFVLKTSRVGEELAQDQPKIEKIEILRGLPNTLKVQVSERQAGIIWQTQERYYLVDERGVIYAERQSLPEDPDIIVVKDTNNVGVSVDSHVVTPQFVQYLIKTKNELPSSKLQAKSFEVSESINNFTVITDKGFKILMSSVNNLDNQLSAITQVLAEKPEKVKQYLDVRVEGKAYYI